MEDKQMAFVIVGVGKNGLKCSLYGLYCDGKPVTESEFAVADKDQYTAKLLKESGSREELDHYVETNHIRTLTGEDCDLGWTLEFANRYDRSDFS